MGPVAGLGLSVLGETLVTAENSCQLTTVLKEQVKSNTCLLNLPLQLPSKHHSEHVPDDNSGASCPTSTDGVTTA